MQVEPDNSVLKDTTFSWPLAPNIYSRGEMALSSLCEPSPGGSCTCFEWESTRPRRSHSRFRPIVGDWRLGLYVQDTDDNFRRDRDRAHACMKKQSMLPLEAPLKNCRLNPDLLSDYLSFITRGVNNDENFQEAIAPDTWFEANKPGTFLTGRPSLPIELCKTLFTLELASSVYAHLESATISLEASLSEPLFHSEWVPTPICERLDPSKHFEPITPELLSPLPVTLTRQQAFSCVAKFDSGHVELDPAGLHSALALCTEDSMYVAAVVLFDPFEQPEAYELRRIVGNIGHPGISLLVAPEEPRIRPPSNEYTAISHVSYDFQRQNNFAGTSLHLSFTDWRFPLEAGGHRTIDQGVIVVEAVISVLDRGKWVADLDMLCIDFGALSRIINECDKHEREDHDLEYDYTSIDNWDELLDSPEGVGIFRAHGNWAARLAAVSILSQRGQGHSIGLFGAGNICFKCLEADTEDNADYLMANESPLPSICID